MVRRALYVLATLLLASMLLVNASLSRAEYIIQHIELPEPDAAIAEIPGVNYVYMNSSFLRLVGYLTTMGYENLSSQQEVRVYNAILAAFKEYFFGSEIARVITANRVNYTSVFLRIEDSCPALVMGYYGSLDEGLMRIIAGAADRSMDLFYEEALKNIEEEVEHLLERSRDAGGNNSELASIAMSLNSTATQMISRLRSCPVKAIFHEALAPTTIDLNGAYSRLINATMRGDLESLDRESIRINAIYTLNTIMVIVEKPVDKKRAVEAAANMFSEMRRIVSPEIPIVIVFTEPGDGNSALYTASLIAIPILATAILLYLTLTRLKRLRRP